MKPVVARQLDRIDRDVHCIQCGYNLRDLALRGVCPECGRRNAHSLQAEANQRITPTSALLALLLIATAPSFGAWMMFWSHRGQPLGSVAYALGKAWLYGLPLIWLLLVDRGRPSLSKPQRGGLGVGALLGLAISACVLAAYHLFAQNRIDPAVIREVVEDNGLHVRWRYVAACLWLAAVNALLEEYAFRWFIYTRCERLMKPLLAVIVAGIIFTIHHVIVVKAYFDWDITILASAGVFIGGCAWSALYHRYRSIWPGYISHVIVDIAIFVIGWKLIFGDLMI